MKKSASLLLILFINVVFAFSQSTTGKIVGTVSAPDGAVAGATVTVTDTQTGSERTVTANSEGTFEVPQLSFGVYTVKITAKGFKTFTATEVKIDAGRDYPLNAVLEVGQVSEQVTVTAGAENVNSTGADLTTTVTTQQIKELPLNGRNPLSLLNLQAGVNATSSSINGQRTSSVNYTRDGLNVQDNFIRNGFVSDAPTVDNTGEFNVVTQNAGAELGTGSTQVQLVTPRGGKQIHGALYEFNRNSYFASNSFLNNYNGVGLAFLNRNQFGGSISGPLPVPNFGEGGPLIKHDKSYFFFNYEGFRLAQQASLSATTLVGAAQNGTFSYIDTAGATQTVNVLTGSGLNLSTTANATVFTNAGGVLPVDPIIKSRLLSQLPTTGNGSLTGVNYLQTVNLLRADPEQRNAFTGRVDFDVSDRSSLNFVYKRNNIADARTDIAAGFANQTFVSQGGPTNFFVGAFQWTPKNNLSNEFRAGFQRSEPLFYDTTALPTNYLIAGTNFTSPEQSFFNQGRNTNYYNVQDNAVYTLGNHSLRFGFQFQRYRITSLNYAGVTPTYTISSTANAATPALTTALFTNGTSIISSTDLARANALRYTLAGIIGGANLTEYYQGPGQGYVAGAPSKRKFNFDVYAGYASDQWRFRPNLTINYGARYEVYTPLHDPLLINLEPQVTNPKDIVGNILSPNVSFQVVGGNAGKPGDYFKTDWNNIGPNLSFAYSPKFEKGTLGLLTKDTVIRGGVRVNYNNDEYVRSTDNAEGNNAGLGTVTINAKRGTSTLLASSLSNVAGFTGAITFAQPTINTYPARLQDVATTYFDTVSLVDPKLQLQQTLEYNIGIQRNVGFKSVLEVRYVGGASNQMTRSIDENQIKINGVAGGVTFLSDFFRAQQNCALQGATLAPAGAFDTKTYCTSAAYNPAIAGSQPLPFFSALPGGALLTNSTILGYIRGGQPADLAYTYLSNGYAGYVGDATRSALLNNPAAGVVNLTTNGGRYRYNSLQAELRRRFSGGWSYQVNYTFQKILTDVVDDTQTRVDPYLDNANSRYDYARPDYDRTHTINGNFIYELPVGKGKYFLNEGGWKDKVFGGFQLSSIINISSGIPFGVDDPRGTLNRAGRSGRQGANSSLTTTQLKKYFGVFKTPNGVFYINPTALYATGSNGLRVDLTQPLPTGVTITGIRGLSAIDQAPFSGQLFTYVKAGQIGNLPKNFANGPMYFNWDMGLSKNIRFGESMRLELRGEVFNVLNHANFAIGDLVTTNVTNFGKVTSNYTPRILQFGARFDF